LAFGLFFAAIMAPSVGCGGRTSVILVARTQHINLGPSGPEAERVRARAGTALSWRVRRSSLWPRAARLEIW